MVNYAFGSAPGAFSVARCCSQRRARSDGDLDYDSGRQNEVHDQAMIKWGVKLYDSWGYRPAARRCYARP